MTWYADLPHDQAGGDGGVRSITQMVVIHATDNTADAAAEAHYAETRPDGTSAHFYSDETVVIQALDTDHIAFGCYPIGNSRSVQFEICGLSNQLTDASLRKVAPVVARVCQEYGLPIRKISSADLVAGAKGICGHIDVTYAWNQGDHTDPGSAFPWSTFIGYVQAALNPPAVDEEDDEEMSTAEVPRGFGAVATQQPDDTWTAGTPTDWTLVTGGGLGPVNGGAFNNKRAVLGLGCDGAGPDGVLLRVAVKAEGKGWGVKVYKVTAGGNRVAIFLDDGVTKFSITRVQRLTDADDGPAAKCPVWWDLEFEKR